MTTQEVHELTRHSTAAPAARNRRQSLIREPLRGRGLRSLALAVTRGLVVLGPVVTMLATRSKLASSLEPKGAAGAARPSGEVLRQLEGLTLMGRRIVLLGLVVAMLATRPKPAPCLVSKGATGAVGNPGEVLVLRHKVARTGNKRLCHVRGRLEAGGKGAER
jgi:hypothetical protein